MKNIYKSILMCIHITCLLINEIILFNKINILSKKYYIVKYKKIKKNIYMFIELYVFNGFIKINNEKYKMIKNTIIKIFYFKGKIKIDLDKNNIINGYDLYCYIKGV